MSMLDTVNVLIGFATVMLLLSLVVTALVQATQHLLFLRGKNLRKGLQSLLDFIRPDQDPYRNKIDIDLILETPIISPDSAKKTLGFFAKRLAQNWCTWVSKQEFVTLMANSEKPLKGNELAMVDLWFERMERNMAALFSGRIRLIAIGWAVAVAITFQLNTPSLLRQLSTDPEYRARAAAAAPGALRQAEGAFKVLSSYEAISDHALQQLEEEHPDLEELLEMVSGIGPSDQDVLDELDAILSDVPERRDEVMGRYVEILDDMSAEARRAALDETERAVGALAMIDVQPWPEGVDFYFQHGKPKTANIFGVLLTAILLTFGAPAWYEFLKKMLVLGDLLKGTKAPSADGIPSHDEQGGDST